MEFTGDDNGTNHYAGPWFEVQPNMSNPWTNNPNGSMERRDWPLWRVGWGQLALDRQPRSDEGPRPLSGYEFRDSGKLPRCRAGQIAIRRDADAEDKARNRQQGPRHLTAPPFCSLGARLPLHSGAAAARAGAAAPQGAICEDCRRLSVLPCRRPTLPRRPACRGLADSRYQRAPARRHACRS